MDIEKRIVAQPQPIPPVVLWMIRKLAGIIKRQILKLEKAIIVNWKRAIIVAVVLYFIGGVFGLWLIIRALS